jgi:hypothetical protein
LRVSKRHQRTCPDLLKSWYDNRNSRTTWNALR